MEENFTDCMICGERYYGDDRHTALTQVELDKEWCPVCLKCKQDPDAMTQLGRDVREFHRFMHGKKY